MDSFYFDCLENMSRLETSNTYKWSFMTNSWEFS